MFGKHEKQELSEEEKKKLLGGFSQEVQQQAGLPKKGKIAPQVVAPVTGGTTSVSTDMDAARAARIRQAEIESAGGMTSQSAENLSSLGRRPRGQKEEAADANKQD